MFCNACGKPNPDGSAFCTSCGNKLPPSYATQTAPPPRQPINSLHTSTTANNEIDLFRSHWRTLASSPFVLIVLICHSISVLLGMYEMNSAFSDSKALLQYIGSPSSAIRNYDLIVTLIQLFIAAPGVLIAIGLWISYADGRNSPAMPINTTGIKLILGTTIAQLVLLCLSCTYLIFTFISAISETDKLGYSLILKETLTKAVFIILIAMVVGIFLYRLYIKLLCTVRDAADLCYPTTEHVIPAAVVEFICAGFLIIATLSNGITVSLLLSCALPIMFGILLLQYKQTMDTISIKRTDPSALTPTQAYETFSNVYSSKQTAHSTEYVPAWKRAELEKETASTEEAAVETNCPACGRERSAGQLFCPYCGHKF